MNARKLPDPNTVADAVVQRHRDKAVTAGRRAEKAAAVVTKNEQTIAETDAAIATHRGALKRAQQELDRAAASLKRSTRERDQARKALRKARPEAEALGRKATTAAAKLDRVLEALPAPAQAESDSGSGSDSTVPAERAPVRRVPRTPRATAAAADVPRPAPSKRTPATEAPAKRSPVRKAPVRKASPQGTGSANGTGSTGPVPVAEPLPVAEPTTERSAPAR